MKNTSNICLIRLVPAVLWQHLFVAIIELITISEAAFCANQNRVSVWDPFCSSRGKENQLMSEVRTVERNMIPKRDNCRSITL